MRENEIRALMEVMKLVGTVTILMIFVYFFVGCGTLGSNPMGECRLLCQGQKVDTFKDETTECKCRVTKEASQ